LRGGEPGRAVGGRKGEGEYRKGEGRREVGEVRLMGAGRVPEGKEKGGRWGGGNGSWGGRDEGRGGGGGKRKGKS